MYTPSKLTSIQLTPSFENFIFSLEQGYKHLQSLAKKLTLTDY